MRTYLFATILLFITSTLFLSSFGQENKFQGYFIDSTDYAFDMSGFLATRIGFMPVPFIVTEPAVGYGVGLGLIFFHRSKEEKESRKFSKLPPSLSMVGGLYTENGTWAGMIVHQGSYKKDHIRYLGMLGYTDLNIDFYGAGIVEEERAYHFNITGFFALQELAFRIKNTPLFIGANYSYFNNDIIFKTGLEIPELEELTRSSSVGGINLLVMYDRRDNIFTPNKGIFAALEIGKFAPWLGGQTEYNNSKLRFYGYVDKIKKVVAGFRFNGEYKWGDVPFYSLPYIQLRGIPVMRYQDNMVLVGETEWRWNVWRRWSVLGFVGAGIPTPDLKSIQLDMTKISYGTGFRYFIAKEYGMQAGLDFAWGPEDFIWYITVGSAWFR